MVLSVASNVDSVSKIREIAIFNPEERVTAAQMLVKHFDGPGLSTPQNQLGRSWGRECWSKKDGISIGA